MPTTLVVEDGTGLEDANSYATLEEADALHADEVHSAAWAATAEDSRKKALVTATRMLDQFVEWNGYKKTEDQALQWPRTDCPDPDRAGGREFMPDDEVPKFLVRAVCFYALAVLSQNPEVQPSGQGLSDFELTGVMSVSFDLSTRPEMVPEWVQLELLRYGRPASTRSGTVKLLRV